MVPSLSASLGIVSGPGALPRLRNLTNLETLGSQGENFIVTYCGMYDSF